jgi:DNA-binding beta-propeller fold protein YncE
VRTVIGEGDVGRADGRFETARFYRPQGLALDGDVLYVADTENHLVRAADLTTGTVRTVAGNGYQAAWGEAGGATDETPLSSPWDLCLRDSLLFVAMAGSHQVWIVDLVRSLAIPYAGSGREARIDGSVDEAAFAQPSGLAIGGSTMFVADSESNIIRAIALPPTNQVRTLAGGDLFEFGDRDARGDAARFQHPLGVAWSNGRVLIADTYNHKIRSLNPQTGDVSTLAGDGNEGRDDGAAAVARFYEPGGLSATSTALFVADTNNHAIRRLTWQTRRIDTVDVRLPA